MRQKTLNLRGRLLLLERPLVMGIINVTPDSFYPESRKSGEKELIERIEEIITEGGSIVDVGGCSTRPGSSYPEAKEEMLRLRPVLDILSHRYPEVIVSVDTFRSEVAKMAVQEYGAHIINDISGGTADSNMFRTVAELQVPYVLMHIKGNIETMHQNTDYFPDVETEVVEFFRDRLFLLRECGVNDVILDPGYGFSKDIGANFRLLGRSYEAFSSFHLPILTGVSRKRMIWKTLNSSSDEALNGTTVLNTMALLADTADILRVHDVREAVEAITLVESLRRALPSSRSHLFSWFHP